MLGLLSLSCHTMLLEAYACEREREGRQCFFLSSVHLNLSPSSKACVSKYSQTSGRLFNKRDRERRLQWKIRLRSCGNLAALHTDDTALKDVFSCKSVFVLREKVFWVFEQYRWIVVPDVSKKHSALIFSFTTPRIHRNHEDHSCGLLRNVGKISPNHMAPQLVRPGSWTITRGILKSSTAKNIFTCY